MSVEFVDTTCSFTRTMGAFTLRPRGRDEVLAELGCRMLWSEDLSDGQLYESLKARNPFCA
jgi:hypothetical protein